MTSRLPGSRRFRTFGNLAALFSLVAGSLLLAGFSAHSAQELSLSRATDAVSMRSWGDLQVHAPTAPAEALETAPSAPLLPRFPVASAPSVASAAGRDSRPSTGSGPGNHSTLVAALILEKYLPFRHSLASP